MQQNNQENIKTFEKIIEQFNLGFEKLPRNEYLNLKHTERKEFIDYLNNSDLTENEKIQLINICVK